MRINNRHEYAKRGFTLGEITMALFVITLVAIVSLKITTQKTENVIKYYYYGAYTALKGVASEITTKSGAIPTGTGGLCTALGDYLNVSVNNCDKTTYNIDAPEGVNFTAGGGLLEDLTLRSGAKIYNSKYYRAPINYPANILYGNSDNDKNGYIIYVDVDGVKGKSILWQDIFPFYITVSGKVIPAYNPNVSSPAGANNKQHLAMTVKYDDFTGTNRATKWLNVNGEIVLTFQQAACMSGYTTSPSYYCTGIANPNSVCTTEADCKMIPAKPTKYL